MGSEKNFYIRRLLHCRLALTLTLTLLHVKIGHICLVSEDVLVVS